MGEDKEVSMIATIALVLSAVFPNAAISYATAARRTTAAS